jgi:hypothetical protein
VVKKILLIIGLVSSLTVQAGSAERFCADIVKKYNRGQPACNSESADTMEEVIRISSYCGQVWDQTKAGYEELIGYGAAFMTVKRQFESCVFNKKQEQDDSSFLKYLDRY